MRTVKTTRFYLTGILSLAIILTLYGGAVLAKQEGKPQKLCPILGGEIDKSAYVDYEGKRVYFCCPGCKASFLKDSHKYIKEMESQGILLEKASHANAGHEHGDGPGAHDCGSGHGNHDMHGGSMH